MTGPIITLLTDFGLREPYVGVMRGVLLARCPTARLVDLTHELDPHDVRGGAFWLEYARPWFPAGTVHLAVVDPGVGSARAGLAVEAGGHFLVGPDNGLLAGACDAPGARVHRLAPARLGLPVPSRTFHGRDVFAPVAALLADGAPLESVGDPVSSWVPSPLPVRPDSGAAAVGVVVAVDWFGNLITTLPAPSDTAGVEVSVDGRAARWVECYEAGAPGELVALAGSAGTVELAVREQSAWRVLGGRPRRVELTAAAQRPGGEAQSSDGEGGTA